MSFVINLHLILLFSIRKIDVTGSWQNKVTHELAHLAVRNKECRVSYSDILKPLVRSDCS
jgi:hypothetical protein